MKKIIAFFLLTGFALAQPFPFSFWKAAAGGGGTPAFGAENTRGSETLSSGTTVVAITGAGISSGNVAVIFISWESPTETVTSVTDSKGNTWTLGTAAQKGGSANIVLASSVLSSSLTSSASDTLTITWGTPGFSYRYWMLASTTGTGATQPDSQNSGASTFGTVIDAPTATPVAAKTIVFAGFTYATGTTYTGGTWTIIGAPQTAGGTYQSYYAYKVFSSAPGAVTPDGSLSSANSTGGVNISLK